MCPTMPPILSFSASPGRWSHILIPFLPLVATAKSVNVYGLCKRFLPTSTQVSYCYSVDYKSIYYLNNMILHFFPRHPMVFFISSWEDLRGFDFINYIYIQTQTNLAGWCPKVLKSTCNYMAKTDHSGQRKGKNRNVTNSLTFSLWSIFSQMWSLSKHAKLNIYFLNLANLIFFKP